MSKAARGFLGMSEVMFEFVWLRLPLSARTLAKVRAGMAGGLRDAVA